MKQEHQKCILRKQAEARQARYHASGDLDPSIHTAADSATIAEGNGSQGVQKATTAKRDFFGRPMSREESALSDLNRSKSSSGAVKEEKKVWVTYHEGYSNAVRKPITLEELLKEFENPV